MTIIYHDSWEMSERGKSDAARHQKKIDSMIRKNVQDVIGEESIITQKDGKTVKIPVKGLRDYRFIYDPNDDEEKSGVGQGDFEDGQIIGQERKSKEGEGSGAGNEPGGESMETEVPIDYLIEIMFDDLGLPYMDEKTKAKNLVPKGWKFESITKKGILPRLHKKKTMIEAIKRSVMFQSEIIESTGCSEEDAQKALIQADGDINDAINIIDEGRLSGEEAGIFIDDNDLRFKQIEQDVEYHSNAVVLAMMDTSGSMDTRKKYLARSMLFWMVEFLKKTYDNVEIRFIQHTTEAHIVNEDDFFKKSDMGGTLCHTAFDKANYLIDTEYPIEEWNVYCMYLSDGDDFDPNKTVRSIKTMLDKKINMLGYTEISLEGDPWGGDHALLRAITEKWSFTKKKELGTLFLRNDENHFLISMIKNKKHVYPSLRHFLFEPVQKQ